MVIYLKHKSPLQFEMKIMSESVLQIGLCVPRSCSVEEIANLTGNFFMGEHANRVIRSLQLVVEKDAVIEGKVIENTLNRGFSWFLAK